MTQEKWQELITSIRDKYQVAREDKGELVPGPGHFEAIEFSLPLGEFKLELRFTPRVLDKKTHYTNRAGASTTVEYVYDEKELALTLHAYKKNNGEWEEMSADGFSGHL